MHLFVAHMHLIEHPPSALISTHGNGAIQCYPWSSVGVQGISLCLINTSQSLMFINIIIICDIYRTVKNFGGQKVWRKGLLQSIGGKNFGEKSVVSVRLSNRNKRRATI